MAHKYEHVSTGNGYWVLNNGVRKQVIAQDGSILTPVTTTNLTTTGNTILGNAFTDTLTISGPCTIGTLATPITLATNPGATVSVDTVNILHSAGAGDCDDLLGRYTKVAISGAGDSGLTAVADAPRAYVLAGVAKEVYGSQPWVSHAGTGAVTAMSALSAKCDVNTDNFTASTINAGHFHVEGAATVTGQFDGVMIEVYPDVTCLDSGLSIAVDAGATVTSAIRTSGEYTNVLEFAAANSAVVVGSQAYGDNASGYLVIKVGSSSYKVPFI